jgi:hypothetical protein
MTVVH